MDRPQQLNDSNGKISLIKCVTLMCSVQLSAKVLIVFGINREEALIKTH